MPCRRKWMGVQFTRARITGGSGIWKPWNGSWRGSIHNYQAATGSIRVASLFLTFPTRALTGHAIIAPAYGTSIDFS